MYSSNVIAAVESQEGLKLFYSIGQAMAVVSGILFGAALAVYIAR